MTRRRRALLLATLSVLLGALAASEVAGREAALDRRIGPTVAVLVARVDLPPGAPLRPAVLAVRRLPARWAPIGAFRRPADVTGLTAAVPIAAGTDLAEALVRDPQQAAPAGGEGAPASRGLRPGERVAEIVARGDARLLGPGSRIDLLVTREGADGSGGTTLALEDAEVLAAAPVAAAADEDAGPSPAGSRVALSLRVGLREAVALTAAQNFAKEVRVLVRVDGDRRRGARGLTVRDGRPG